MSIVHSIYLMDLYWLFAGFAKSYKIAETLLDQADAEFSLGNFEKALRGCTLALMFFKEQGEAITLALVYSKRATILQELGHFQRALLDIERALDCSKTVDRYLRDSLLARQQECNQVLRGQSVNANFQTKCEKMNQLRAYCKKKLFTLEQGNTHERIQEASSSIDIRYEECCGRKLVAARDIHAGIK